MGRITTLAVLAAVNLCTAMADFTSTGSEQDWDILNLGGSGIAEEVPDLTCPHGYGPEVLHLQGELMLALAKGVSFEEGTMVALYRELAPRTEDADGVLLFWADYGVNVEEVHNTKARNNHFWLEQDGDTGFQLRHMSEGGAETDLASVAGAGLVTGEWNQTNWIWQKLRIRGNTVEAKYWPAELPEPAEWTIRASYDGPKGARCGLKINSGDIHVAFFAASKEDIAVETPRAYLAGPLTPVTQPESVMATLFLNAETEQNENLTVRALSGRSALGAAEFNVRIPAGASRVPFFFTVRTDSTQGEGHRINMSKAFPEGEASVEIKSASGRFDAIRAIEIAPVSEFRARLELTGGLVGQLGEAVAAIRVDNDQTAALRIVYEAASAHWEHAKERLDAGFIDEADRALRFAVEALDELKGYKGAWLARYAQPVRLDGLPGYGPRTLAPKEEQKAADVYSPDYLISAGSPELGAGSLVMGGEYTVRIPWRVEGASPDRDFAFEVRLVNRLGNRTVARSAAPPEAPASAWKPGETYWQTVTLSVTDELPDQQNLPAETVIEDNYYYLCVSVKDPDTGGTLILGNEAGAFPDRPVGSYVLDEIYIASAPLQIQAFAPLPAPAVAGRTDRVTLANHGDEERVVDVLLTAMSETGAVLFQDARAVTLDGQSQTAASFDWTPLVAGEITLWMRVLDGSHTVTEAKETVALSAPTNAVMSATRASHVVVDGGSFYTPLTVSAPGAGAFSVEVYAGDRLVGDGRAANGSVTLDVEPWFGYYDVVADFGNYRSYKRIIATVVETNETDLIVNGEPFIVKGTNVHGMDWTSPERTRTMMRIMRDLGFNTWRGDYPARWQVDLAYEMNTAYTVLAPFSVTYTDDIFARQDGPALTTVRELSRLTAQRYRDSAGVLFWNSANEIQGENVDLILSAYPVYHALDPAGRVVHYANLFGQDIWQGQDLMSVNYYFGLGQRAVEKQPLIERSFAIAQEHGLPLTYTEFNSWYGAVPTTGVEAMGDMFAWGVDLGMMGGWHYMKGDSDRHPGVFDSGFNTHRIHNDAIRDAFADARVEMLAESRDAVTLKVVNKRRFTLRDVQMSLTVSGVKVLPYHLADIAPGGALEVTIPLTPDVPGPTRSFEGALSFTTHFGFNCNVPFFLIK